MSDFSHQINYGSKVITYSLAFSNRKSLGIKVLPDSSVNVIAPLNAHILDIQEKIKSKAKWILKQQNFFRQYKPITPERKFVNGETHLYLGRQYKLKVVQSEDTMVKVYRGEIILFVQKASNVSFVKKSLAEWYSKKAEVIFRELLSDVSDLFSSYKIKSPVLEIRRMEKRWGSCNKAGKITLNIDLIKAHKGCIEYVIIHELCHLVHYNHTKDFYNLLGQLCPDWEKWKDKLEHQLV